MENIYMSRGASKVVNTCLKVQPGEQILMPEGTARGADPDRHRALPLEHRSGPGL